MKKQISLLLIILICLGLLAGCGKKKDADSVMLPDETQAPQKSDVQRVQINLNNIYNYFEYTEIKNTMKNDNGTISNVQVSYALKLKDEYKPADPELYKNTLEVEFTARGVIREGEYQVNYDTLEYTGSTNGEPEYTAVNEKLSFWPQGGRTTAYTYGNYSSTFIIYLENFTVTNAGGYIYIMKAES